MSCHSSATPVIPGGFNDSDSSTDYGSDFSPEEEALLNDLLAKVAPDPDATTIAATATVTPALSQQPSPAVTPVARDIEDQYAAPSSSRVPRVLGREKPAWQVRSSQQGGARPAPIPGYIRTASGSFPPFHLCGFLFRLTLNSKRLVEHPDSTEGREKERERQAARHEERIKDVNAELDTRSPVERFRRPPHKAFSVTDLISPAWCELQYWYTLTKFGRKRRTPAMKLGSTIHKTLEDEIYMTVPVEITTKEDALALRIWNIIQGLRTLREYGITRELEVWGLVDGELVTGVIDQLSYECPDPKLEATAATYYADIEASRAILPEYQMSLTDYLLASGGGKLLSDVYEQEDNAPKADDSVSSSQESNVPRIPRIYLTDVKTRGKGSAPTVKSTSFRPTLLQLQLYYHMLNRLATSDDVTIDLLASRYNLDANRPFTDAFISEVGGLNDQYFDALASQEFDPDYIPTPQDAIEHRQPPHSSQSSSTSQSQSATSQDSTSILLTHNTLTSLWSLMKEQFRLTFFPSPDSLSVAPSIPSEFQPRMLEPYPTILSPLLTARYISSAPTADLHPKVLGSRSFLFDPTSMTSYITDQMHWWRGERDPRGVEVMEAWKCRICEFKDECSWRQEREWTYARRSMGRKAEEYDVNV
ncbi:exonuclease V [Aspergillus ibericus CBS 121593]|uniref:Uncharacterized protein n=1 Tax=Aspergillus ibericus CBS 121593 TaxID=1448316 RepID=A0A395GPQ5_9EURO|nr:hypothetical protein BO80DRAFT_414457 [Aspergillus ibericus CBS 121593]RAK97475.1 hypothetical protein BO80DRAFT_414457 [Aspergillus ibericus CBS 121593]